MSALAYATTDGSGCTQLEQEVQRLRGELREKSAIITGILHVLGNDGLTAADRIIAIKATLVREDRLARREGSDEAPVSLQSIAQGAAVSRARVTAFRQKLKSSGIFIDREEKSYEPPKNPNNPKDRGTWRTTVFLQRPETSSVPQTLERLATVTIGRSKAGGKRDKKQPILVPPTCQNCGSDEITVTATCAKCHHTAEFTAEQTTGGEGLPKMEQAGSLQNGALRVIDTSLTHSTPSVEPAPKWSNPPGPIDTLPEELAPWRRINEARSVEGAALAYTQRLTIPVFPVWGVNADGSCQCDKAGCDDAGKHPIWDLAPHGVKNATLDSGQIRAWFQTQPNANIGLAMGEERRLIVIDVDEEGVPAFRRLQAERSLTPTLVARTGSGGEHHVYEMPAGMVHGNGTGQLPAGIHVRGQGGYIVAAPSRHKSGECYVWEDIRPITELPPALLQLLQPPAPRPYVPPARPRGRFITTGHPIYEGDRNEALFSVGCAFENGGARGTELETLLLESNHNRCRPPLPEAEVRKIARSVEAHVRRKRQGGGGL